MVVTGCLRLETSIVSLFVAFIVLRTFRTFTSKNTCYSFQAFHQYGCVFIFIFSLCFNVHKVISLFSLTCSLDGMLSHEMCLAFLLYTTIISLHVLK